MARIQSPTIFMWNKYVTMYFLSVCAKHNDVLNQGAK